MRLGSEVFFSNRQLHTKWSQKRVGWLCHAASVNQNLQNSLDLAVVSENLNVTAAFGPQHGIMAEKQDNMVESDHFIHPVYKIPVFSLYGEVRRPTKDMFDHIDVLFVDLQDVGCRIYTFLTTLFYCLDAAQAWNKSVVVLDRPNPSGREIEGNKLDMSYESFIGAAPLPMRHGLTLGEAGKWYVQHKGLSVDYEVVKMENYWPGKMGHYDWPSEYPWVNPSPNIPRLSCTQIYPGTVLLEGTLLSEGRGTTLPLEMFGGPGMDPRAIVQALHRIYPGVDDGCLIRPCFFEPTFHKHAQKLCGGVQIHVDHPKYQAQKFKPYRLVGAYLKAIRELYPEFELWKQPPYEYEYVKMPIDILSGGEQLRNWVEDKSSTQRDLEQLLIEDEKSWKEEVSCHYMY